LKRVEPSGPFSGIKRSLTDGGICVPCIAWWPDGIAPGRETGCAAYFGDWLATLPAQLAGAAAPDGLDSFSFGPTLLGDRNNPFRSGCTGSLRGRVPAGRPSIEAVGRA
jgi:arylsulfatase A-like enzyme